MSTHKKPKTKTKGIVINLEKAHLDLNEKTSCSPEFTEGCK